MRRTPAGDTGAERCYGTVLISLPSRDAGPCLWVFLAKTNLANPRSQDINCRAMGWLVSATWRAEHETQLDATCCQVGSGRRVICIF
jgi:hypothetical protein